jgi:hypothetical protein
MLVTFDDATNRRLARVEQEEGMPAAELVREAVGVWSYMSADERRAMGMNVMKVVLRRQLEIGGQA